MIPAFGAAAPEKSEQWEENLSMTFMCKDCREDPPNLVEEFSSGDVVCGSCGLVLGDRIVDTRSEWRTFSNDDAGNDDPSRVGDGPNLLLNGSQLQTTIAFDNGGARSRDLMRAQGKSTADKATKSLLAAYKEIGAHCDGALLPKQVSDTAKHLYKMVDDAKAFKGKSTESLIAACIFIACRQCDVGRTFREIYAMTKVPKKDIGRTFKALEKFLSGKNATANAQYPTNDTYTATKATAAADFIIRFCSKLGLKGQSVVRIAQGLTDKANASVGLSGRSPVSIAAACIYMAAHFIGVPKTAKDVGAVTAISDGTIRTIYKLLYLERDRLIEPSWVTENRGKMENLPVG